MYFFVGQDTHMKMNLISQRIWIIQTVSIPALQFPKEDKYVPVAVTGAYKAEQVCLLYFFT